MMLSKRGGFKPTLTQVTTIIIILIIVAALIAVIMGLPSKTGAFKP